MVIKVGSSSLTNPAGAIDPASIDRTVAQVRAARGRDVKPILVTSGAVAASLAPLNLNSRPNDIPGLQAAAAVGQGLLMQHYANAFGDHGIIVAQVLLTRDVFASRVQYLHARDAVKRMIEMGVLPIVNENDTVAVDELRFGDNDQLAAMVCHLVDADMLVLLTDTKGLYSVDPRVSDSGELIAAVQHNDAILDDLYRDGSGSSFGSGGATTKIAAARMAAWSGIPTVIARATDHDIVERALSGEDVGTWIAPRPSRLSARKLWIAFGLPARGEVLLDPGAAEAIGIEGRSLLAAGVTGTSGKFTAGDAVSLVGPNGRAIGKGLIRMDTATVIASIGQHSSLTGGEVIHRDDLVVFD